MKNRISNIKNHIIKVFIITFLIVILLSQCSYAGFADFDDETAEEQAQNDLKEQEKNDKENLNNSSNNYLENLVIKGYELKPSFDKQIINYQIEKEVTDNEIEVQAVAADSRAKITGIGKISLQSGENNLKIDVEAENGVKRSYFIKLKKSVNIMNNKISNITLKTIDKNGITKELDFDKEFNPNVYRYNCKVSSDIEKINVEIGPSELMKDVRIEKNDTLVTGLNTIKISYGENENEVIYIIEINKDMKQIEKEEIKNENKFSNNIVGIIISIIVVIIVLLFIFKNNKRKK